jgi:hypothetical protein
MAYWWVSQNQTYRHERGGGFLWAPNQTEAGLTQFHWATMNEVRPGDLIFSYVGQRIVSVAIAKTASYDSPRPSGMGEGLWGEVGKRVDVEYRDISDPLAIAEIVADLQPLLPTHYGPLNRLGTGNQGYLFALPPRAGRFLLDHIDGADLLVLEQSVGQSTRDSTQRLALVLSRVGQGQFRDDVIQLWGERCAVSGLDLLPLLRASHIKPWKDSDNRERLDPYNGLLLSPAYDACFDAGLITFTADGKISLSAALTPARIERIGLNPNAQIAGLHARHRIYLEHHRSDVFTV